MKSQFNLGMLRTGASRSVHLRVMPKSRGNRPLERLCKAGKIRLLTH